MSDSVKKWHEMQGEIKASLQADKEMAAAGIGQENKNVENQYLFVLDYLDGKVYRYDISSLGNEENNWIPSYETCEAFLIGAGHSISNIEWMATKTKELRAW